MKHHILNEHIFVRIGRLCRWLVLSCPLGVAGCLALGVTDAHKLTVVTTDFGADCDDQKAVSGLISSLGPGEEMAFIVNGPRPRSAAAAIAEKYHDATGHYPLLTLVQQFGEDKLPEDRVYSLVSATPIGGKNLSSISSLRVTTERFQRAIDAQIRKGKINQFEQIVLAPLRSDWEYYNPTRSELSRDADFQERWESVQKVATTQFQWAGGRCSGNNYMKSAAGVADRYTAMLHRYGFVQVYIDGTVAKDEEFLMPMRQPRLPGVGKAIEAYIALKQVPWLHMTEDLGKLPDARHMHAAMFTSSAQVPFGVHVSATNPAGFGAQRALKEVCGIDPVTEPEKYTATMRRINAELDHFDRQVLTILRMQHPEVADVPEMRAAMHAAVVDALQDFARRKGLIGNGGSVDDFKHLFDLAKRKNHPLNAYQYMQEYKEILFGRSPLTRAITEIAEAERDKPRPGGQSHADVMASILGSEGARAVMYDAVAVEASRAARRNPKLWRHFADGDKIINITQESVRRLRETDPALHKEFQMDVVSGLVKDGGRTTASSWMIEEGDPARLEIVRRAKALGITGDPDQAAHNLGKIKLASGEEVTAHVVHAVDPIITDGKEVVMINRRSDPGKGKPALPGGFLDPAKGGGAESGVQAAAREAMEEVGVSLGEGKVIGSRNMDRPHDVRVAQNDLPPYAIRKGDIFMVSTQGVRFDVSGLAQTKLIAGDDAMPGSARRVAIASLTRDDVGIPDHFDMIMQALGR
jgi:NUDIX domain